MFLAGGAIALAVVAAYVNTLSCPFVFDDHLAILENRSIRHLWSSWFTTGDYVSASTARPIVNFSFAVNYALGGFNPQGYHALNLIIHLISALALFGIARHALLSVSRRSPSAFISPHDATALAFVIALLWAVHPLLTESVTCVAQRTESLVGLFYLLTLYFFIRAAETGRSGFIPDASGINPDLHSRLWCAASIVACLLGMASKEVMVSAPLMVLLYDRTFIAGTFWEALKRRAWYYAALACTWSLLAYLFIAAGGTRGTAAGFGLGVTWWNYLLTQCRAIMDYLRLSVWPYPLVLDYGIGVERSLLKVLPQAIVLVLLFGATLYALWRRPLLGFIGIWFFAILSPSSSVVPLVMQTEAEHRMYLPLISIVALAACGLYRVAGRRAFLYGGLGLAALLAALTICRNKDYQSELSIWTDTVNKRPDNPRALYSLANVLLDMPGRTEDAMRQYQAAIDLNPDDAQAHYNLGRALNAAGRTSDAIAEYKKAIQLDPNYAEAHNNLASSLLISAPPRITEAIQHYQTALRLSPNYVDAHYNLGIALDDAKRIEEAIVQYKEAARLDPDYAAPHYNLGSDFSKTGNIQDAIEEYNEALRIRPDYPAARDALAQLTAK